MTPAKILKAYYLITLLAGLAFTVPTSRLIDTNDVGARGAFLLILCWNVLFVMLLPLVLDWAERRYLKARFLKLEEVAKENPELAAVISAQCEKLSIAGLKLAVIPAGAPDQDVLFSYGLWKSNPRLVVPDTLLKNEDSGKAIPSVEAELARFSRRDHNVIYLIFAGLQATALALLCMI